MSRLFYCRAERCTTIGRADHKADFLSGAKWLHSKPLSFLRNSVFCGWPHLLLSIPLQTHAIHRLISFLKGRITLHVLEKCILLITSISSSNYSNRNWFFVTHSCFPYFPPLRSGTKKFLNTPPAHISTVSNIRCSHLRYILGSCKKSASLI